MVEASFAWVAVKYTSVSAQPIMSGSVGDKNFYMSRSNLINLAETASDVLMIEESSGVYAVMSSSAAFIQVRDNILNGCAWFYQTHNPWTSLDPNWMQTKAANAVVPDATGGGYSCGDPNDWKSILQSSGNGAGSHTGLDNNWRLRGGLFAEASAHSIWLRVSVSHLLPRPKPHMELSSSVVLTSSILKISSIGHECVEPINTIQMISVTGLRFSDFNSSIYSAWCSGIDPHVIVTPQFWQDQSSSVLQLSLSPAVTLLQLGQHFDCTVSGFKNANISAAAAISTMTTFDSNLTPLRTVELEFPATFEAELIEADIALSSRLTSPRKDDAVLTLSWPASSIWVNSDPTLPSYDSSDGSWVFDRSKSQYLDAGARTFNPQSSGFTVLARVMLNQVGNYQRIIDFGSGVETRNIVMGFLQLTLLVDVLSAPGLPRHTSFGSSHTFHLNTWYTISLVYSSATLTFRLYINGVLRDAFPTSTPSSPFAGPIYASNCYIGKSHWIADDFFSGRMKFVAIYDRALSEADVFSQHASNEAPVDPFQNVVLTVSFAMLAISPFKSIFISGLSFSSFNSSSDETFPAVSPRASCINIVPYNVTVLAAFEATSGTSGSLRLNLSTAGAPVSSLTSVVCSIAGFTNSKQPSAATTSVSVSTYDDVGRPLQSKSNLVFPEILFPRVLSSLLTPPHPSTAQMNVFVFGRNAGLADHSGRSRVGFSACTSTTWRSDTILTCRAASGVGFALSAASSVVLNRGALSFAFSYKAPSLSSVASMNNAASSGAVVVSIAGLGMGVGGFSLVSRVGKSTCAASTWRCDSMLLCRVAGGLYGGNIVILSIGIQQGILSAALSYNVPSVALVADDKKHSNSPITGSFSAFVIGRNFGCSAMTVWNRVTGSACQATHWSSDSCIQLRTSSAVALFNTTLMVSFPIEGTATVATLSSVISYNTPSQSIVSSQLLSNISVSGSNFGVYLAVIPRTTSCPNTTISSKTSAFICNSSDLNIRDTGMTVTEASVSVVFSDVSRLDDVIISLWSPQGKNFILMRMKCFGALSCGPLNSVAFDFQILPMSSWSEVPLVHCPSKGNYISDASDISHLRSALLSHTAMGNWSLHITTGTQNQNIESATIYFKTANLDFQIGNSSASSLVWFSDSSVSMKAPGYMDAEGLESSSGWGRNRTVTGLSSGLQSPSSCVYSYPDPVVLGSSLTSSYSASGSSNIQLVGRFFANANSKPRGYAGSSLCATTQWWSDTALTCTLSPSLGVFKKFAVTVDRSAAAVFNSSLLYVPATNGIFNSFVVSAVTAASPITIVGAGFGSFDSTLRVRMTTLSQAYATAWLCDSSISTRLLLSTTYSPGALISIVSIVNNISVVSKPSRLVTISSFDNNNEGPIGRHIIASSGSNVVFANGIGFGSMTDYSVCLKLSLSSGQYSSWSSDSIITSKSSWGFRIQTPTLIASTGINRGNSTHMFNFMSAAVHHVRIVNESSATVLQLNGSNMSPFQIQSLVKIDHRTTSTNWTSDSSLSCVHPWPVSRDSLNFYIQFFDINNAMLSTSTPVNPDFIQSGKSIVESLNVLLYIPAPTEVLVQVNDFTLRGSSMGWTFPTQQNFTPPSFFESELIDVDIVVYNNHTQVYLKDYAPVGVDLHSAIVLYDSGNALQNELVCHGKSQLSKSTTILPNTFATFIRSSFALCSIPRGVASFTLSIVAIIQVRDELGALLNFSSQPMKLTLHTSPQAVLSAQVTQMNFTAGVVSTSPAVVSLVNTGALCSRLVFEYTASVSCLSNQVFVPVAFFPDGSCTDGQGLLALRNKIQRTCDIDLQQWTFSFVGSCQIVIDALLFNSTLTIPISVKVGEPSDVAIIGILQSHIAEGGIIWSNHASVSALKCLELSFKDKCNNTRDVGGFTCKLSGFLSNMSQYALLGETSVDASTNGRCIWCRARTSRHAPLLIRLQVQWLQAQRFLQPLVNVSGPGEAAVVSPVTRLITNQTAAGNVLTPLTFRLFDANGVSVARRNTVIRVRITQRIPRNSPVTIRLAQIQIPVEINVFWSKVKHLQLSPLAGGCSANISDLFRCI
jgi:hypothetical protein